MFLMVNGYILIAIYSFVSFCYL